MARIVVLPPTLASQIAAGEVVERPASAVKELIENALDAGAERCDVLCDGGGVTRISVTDDGEGMSAEDARLALERHATSKLRVFEDLTGIRSYGFRGEALPSIASVSRFALRTRQRGQKEGVVLQTAAGSDPVLSPAGLPVGTTVEVCDLFFNVPARRKFLRSTGTESSHVTGVVEGAALTRPNITFTLTRDSRKVREFLRAGSRAERVAQLFEQEELLALAGERGPLRVEAFVSRPERSRQGAVGLHLVVNSRMVRDRMLAATVAQSFGDQLASGYYPRGVVYLDLPPELLDVNVHPQKTEVRFVDARAAADALYSVLSRELASALSMPVASRSRALVRKAAPEQLATSSPFKKRPVNDDAACTSAPRTTAIVNASDVPSNASEVQDYNSTLPNVYVPKIHEIEMPNVGSPPVGQLSKLDDTEHLRHLSKLAEPAPVAQPLAPSRDKSPLPPQEKSTFGRLRFITQLRKAFLLCEGFDGIYVLDQHAVAERVTLQQLLDQHRTQSISAQTLLFPVTCELSPADVRLVEQFAEQIALLGIDARVRGPAQVSIHAIPRLVQRANPERLLADILSELPHAPNVQVGAVAAFSRMACSGSLRPGESIAAVEAQSLIAALHKVDFSVPCAHGKPVLSVMAYQEIERKQGRK